MYRPPKNTASGRSSVIVRTTAAKSRSPRETGSKPRAFGHYGYEAARVALDALRKAGGPDRRKVLEAVRGTSRRTMVGNIVFDSKGDTLSGLVTMTKADFAAKKFEVAY